MDGVLKTPKDVIDALGGTSQAAKRLGGLSLSQVSNWLNPKRRISRKLAFAVNAALAAQGKHAAPEVFGMVVPVNGAGAVKNESRRKRLGT